jgi:hypothetical protein
VASTAPAAPTDSRQGTSRHDPVPVDERVAAVPIEEERRRLGSEDGDSDPDEGEEECPHRGQGGPATDRRRQLSAEPASSTGGTSGGSTEVESKTISPSRASTTIV